MIQREISAVKFCRKILNAPAIPFRASSRIYEKVFAFRQYRRRAVFRQLLREPVLNANATAEAKVRRAKEPKDEFSAAAHKANC